MTASVLVVLYLEIRSIFGSIEICVGGEVFLLFLCQLSVAELLKKTSSY